MVFSGPDPFLELLCYTIPVPRSPNMQPATGYAPIINLTNVSAHKIIIRYHPYTAASPPTASVSPPTLLPAAAEIMAPRDADIPAEVLPAAAEIMAPGDADIAAEEVAAIPAEGIAAPDAPAILDPVPPAAPPLDTVHPAAPPLDTVHPAAPPLDTVPPASFSVGSESSGPPSSPHILSTTSSLGSGPVAVLTVHYDGDERLSEGSPYTESEGEEEEREEEEDDEDVDSDLDQAHMVQEGLVIALPNM